MGQLTEQGLVIDTFADIRASINEDLRAEYGPETDLSDGSVAGTFVAAVARSDADREELIQAVNSATDPDAATGAALDAVCAITGTQRDPATPSKVTLTLVGDDATVVAVGSQASIPATGAIFETLAEGTMAELDEWQPDTVYAEDDRVFLDGNSFVALEGGTSASSGGPELVDPEDPYAEILDGSVTWMWIGEGQAVVDVESQCTETGPTVGTSKTITEIETPVSGWNNVINLLDADLGTLLESDEALRIKREDELARPGTSTQDAIRAELLEVEGVTAATVFANRTDAEVDGMPPHSIEALVQGGEDQDIWDRLWEVIPAEADTVGDEEGVVTDSQGTEHTMRFSRPEELLIYVDIELDVDEDLYPEDGDDQVKEAIVAYGDGLPTGRDVRASGISAAIFAAVPGVLDVTLVEIGTAPSPSSSVTIPVSLRQLALYDTSRITVASTVETP